MFQDPNIAGGPMIDAPTIETNPFDVQEAKIKRTLAMAEALRGRGAQQPKGQMVDGHFVAPSWAEQLVPLFNQAQAGWAERQADTQQKALTQQQEAGAQDWMRQMPQQREVTEQQPFQAPGIDEADAAQASAGGSVLKKTMQQPTMAERMQWAQQGQRNPLTKALAAAYGADTLIKEPERQAAREERVEARAEREARAVAERQSREEIARQSRELQAAVAAGNMSLKQAQIEMQKFLGQQTLALRADAVAARAEAAAGQAADRNFRVEDRMKNDFEEVTKNYRTGLDAAQQAQVVLNNKPGQKLNNVEQQSLITLFNKFLDPASVVREGEYNRMAQGMGLFQATQNLYDKIAAGSIITPQMAAQIGQVAKLYEQAASGKIQTHAQSYADVAAKRGLDVGSIITNPAWRATSAAAAPAGPPEGAVKPRGQTAAPATAGGPPPGAVRPR